jgi:hypothetical protein
MHGDALKVLVTAPPLGGAANDAVVELLARWLGVSRASLSIVRGHRGRDKIVEIASERPEALRAHIEEALQSLVDKEKRRG